MPLCLSPRLSALRHRVGWAASLLASPFLLVAPGFASETGQAEKGLPQFDITSFPSQIFWLIVSFSVLFWLMAKIALPRVGEVLEARREKITADLERAATLKADAQGVMDAYEKALSEARGQAQKLVAEAVTEATAESQRRKGELLRSLAEQDAQAQRHIANARDAAIASLQPMAAEMTQHAVAKIAGLILDEATAQAAVAAAKGEDRE
jgi:F-type H+-transporting ATPase subunit b